MLDKTGTLTPALGLDGRRRAARREDEDDELEGDAYGVLEVALQTDVADGDPYRE